MNVMQPLGDLMVVMVIVGMGLYGWQHGAFRAALAGLQVLAAAVVALGFAGVIAPLLIQVQCPARIAFATAFLVVVAMVLLLTRLAIGAAVADDAMRLPPVFDRVAGPLLGVFAGSLLAGTILVAWSMAPLHRAVQIDGAKLRLDMGTPLLRTAARCFEEDGLEERLLAAYAGHDWQPRPAAGRATVITPRPAPRPDESSAGAGP